MNRKVVSLQNIANKTGVSVTTVSRVLSNSSFPVKAQLREQILSVARELGYVYKPQANRSRQQLTGNIALLTVTDPFFHLLAEGAEGQAACFGLQLLRATMAEAELKAAADHLVRQGFVAAVTISRHERGLKANLLCASRGGAPARWHALPLRIAEEKGGEIAARHLLDLGHRSFAYLNSMPEASSANRFRQGWLDELRHAGIPDEQITMTQDVSGSRTIMEFAYGRDHMAELLRASQRPTAIVCSSSAIACGAIQEIWRQGFAVPQDFSVIGHGDSIIALAVYPQLTVVESGAYVIGSHVVDLMLKLMSGREPVQSSEFAPALIERESTGPTGQLNQTKRVHSWDHPS